MITLLKWLLLKRRLRLPPDARWYDPASKLIGTYKQQQPHGWQEYVDFYFVKIST